MHGVKRLFAWMIPRFDPARFNVSLVSLRQKGPVGGDARQLRGRHHVPRAVEVRPARRCRPADGDRPEADRHPPPARLRRDDLRPRWPAAIRRIPTILHEHANLTDTPWFQKVADVVARAVHGHRDRGVGEHRGVRHPRPRQVPAREGARSSTSVCRSTSSAAQRTRARRSPRSRAGARSRRRATSSSAPSRGCTSRRATSTWSRRLRGWSTSARTRGSTWRARGRCATALEAQARQLGLGDRFVFVGFVRDVARLLSAFDLSRLPVALGRHAAHRLRGAGDRQGRSSPPTRTACSTC